MGGGTYVTCYKAVVKANLLFVSETWVMIPSIRRTLRGFHHRVSRCLSGTKMQRDTTGRWEYPPLVDTMTASGIEEVETYVFRLQNTIY